MDINLKEISKCEQEIEITVEKETARGDFYVILREFKNYVSIPGFRKGKAPINMVERVYGEHAREEFYKKMLPDYYAKAIEQKELQPIGDPELLDVNWEMGTDLKAKFKFELKPFINIIKYKNLEIPFEEITLKEEMINSVLEDYQNKAAVIEPAETVQLNDEINADICFLDDEDNITKTVSRKFAAGTNQYSSDFNNRILNLKVGDEIKTRLFDNDSKYNDQDFSADIRNREFLIKIKEINRINLPEINDEFAKDFSFDTLQELRNTIEENIKADLVRENLETRKHSILQTLIKENEIVVPPSFIDNYAYQMAKDTAQKYKMKPEDIIPMFKAAAENNIKSYLIIEELKKMENVEISDAEKEEAVKEGAESIKMDLDEYKKLYKKELESESFESHLQEKKILKIVEESSKFVPYPKPEKNEEK